MIGFYNARVRSRRRGGRIVAVAMAVLFVVAIQTASAESTAAIDAATAAGLCSTAYPPQSGTEVSRRCVCSRPRWWELGSVH